MLSPRHRRTLQAAMTAALLLTVAIAAGIANAGTIIDLGVTLNDQGLVEVTCYQEGAPADVYELTITDTVTGAVIVTNLTESQTLVLNELDATRPYAFEVIGRMSDGAIVGESPIESLDPDQSSGWYPPADKDAAAISLALEGGDASNFPFIYTNVRINDVPAGCVLQESDFTAWENGIPQTDYFDVALTGSAGARLVDFVVVGDNSGSMSAERASVIANIGTFADNLVARGYDARFAFMRFGQSSGYGCPVAVNNYGWTDDAAIFRAQYLNQWTVDGGSEPGLLAVKMAAQGYAFRTGSVRVFLLITDEDSNAYSCVDATLADACAVAATNNITVHCAVDCSWTGAGADYCNTGSIRDCSGGLLFPVIADYGPILNAIDASLQQIATIRYRTSNRNFDGVLRTVRVELNACGESQAVEWAYTPGQVPAITRTTETIALSASAQAEGVPLTLACDVVDLYPPFVNDVRLWYRTTGSGVYSSVAMTRISGTLTQGRWSTTLPASAVLRYGIDYYMRASDGLQTVTTPAVDAAVQPHQIAVLPNVPPTIVVESASPMCEGEDMVIRARVVDTTPGLAQVWVRYREVGALLYTEADFSSIGSDVYEVTIPGSAIFAAADLDVEVRARDTYNVSAVWGPVHFDIIDCSNVAPAISQLTVDSPCDGMDMWVDVNVVDETDYVDHVWLQYWTSSDSTLAEIEMANVSSVRYRGAVPGADVVMGESINIAIKARDNRGLESVFGSYSFTVRDCSGIGRCVWHDATPSPLDNSGLDGHGVAWGDLDGDGDDDLYLANAGPNKLLRNEGGGVFSTIPHGEGEQSYDSRGAAWGDFDNDGDLDLYVVNWNGPNVLYRNDSGVLVDATAGDLGCPLQGNNAAWADYDGDGDLDLFVTNYAGPNKLLNNDGGLFTSVASAVGFTDLSRGCAWGDYDNDRDPDLYVSVEDGPNHLFRNDHGILVDVTVAPLDDMGKGKGVDWGDYDNDGDLDLYLVNRLTENRLFVNDGGVFSLSTDPVVADTGDGRSCGWGDYNNDGWLDLFVTNYSGDNKLYHNVRGAFADSTCGDLQMPITAWGMGWNDYDSDGDLDLYVANHNWQGLESHMFRNDLIANKAWLSVRLEGTLSNRGGVGARIVATDPATGFTQMREITAGSSYMSQRAAVAQFGMGDAERVNLSILWPSGIVQVLENQAINQALEIAEVSGTSDTPVATRPFQYAVSNHPNPFNPQTRIEFALPVAGGVKLSVFDVDGRLVKTLLDDVHYGEGEFAVVWNGTDNGGRRVASGVYFYRFESGTFSRAGRMVMLK